MDCTGNLLLDSLSETERLRILTHCEEIVVRPGQVICTGNGRMQHVYFPTGSLLSLLADTEGRRTLEVGLVGREGAWGLALALEVKLAPMHAVALHPGTILRMNGDTFMGELARSASLRRTAGRYLYVSMCQLAQMAACTHFHAVKARLARRLLTMRDGSGAIEFDQTQEFMASMLGVRRVGVTHAAGILQARRMVRYSRGRVVIIDARALGTAACSCYASARRTYSRFMSGKPDRSAAVVA